MSYNFNVSDWRVVYYGNSFLTQYLVPSIPDLAQVGLGVPWVSEAINGEPWADLLPLGPALLDPWVAVSASTVLMMSGGTNDYNVLQDTGQEVYDNMVLIADAARTAGYDKIIACTTTPSTGIVGSEETNRVAGNVLVMSDPDGAFDISIDPANDPDLLDPSNTTWYVDGLHLTLAGRTLFAEDYVAPALVTAMA